MKENKYDESTFFNKYSQMNRSQQGLSGAGEWQEMQKLLPTFCGKNVLDLGCGYGWHCIYAAEHGASSVLGTDISAKMIEVATSKTQFAQVRYQVCTMEDLDCPDNSYDIVISSLAFHYIQDFAGVVQKINKLLTSGGAFVFSVEHPVFTAQGSQNWIYDDNGHIKHFPVDNYYYEGKRTANFLGEQVTKYHKTLTTYLNTLLDNCFQIKQIVEPQPPQNMMDISGMLDEMRRPMMLLVSAIKV